MSNQPGRPGQVTSLTADTKSIHEIELRWAPINQDLDHYNVYRRTAQTIYEVIAEPVTNEFIDGGLSINTTYFYKLSAINILGDEGTHSQQVTQTTSAGPWTDQQARDQKVQELAGFLRQRLTTKVPIPVAFPPCTDLYLSPIRKLKLQPKDKQDKLLVQFFDEYFRYERHDVFSIPELVEYEDYFVCGRYPKAAFSLETCLPPSCITLNGNRSRQARLRRLFIADVVWLFFFEQFGIFDILSIILSDFATRGKYPIGNNNIVSLALEAMTRNTMSGNSSRLRDRTSTYMRVLGWATPKGKKLNLTEVLGNSGFNSTFHRFIQTALAYYKERRLATAVRGQPSPSGPTSAPVSVRIAINDLIDLLRKAFKPFDYGRNYYNTLNGIVWAISTMSLVRELRTTLGIPEKFDDPYQYLSAAYDLLVAGRPITPSQTNRFKLHYECARDARDILLDLEEGALNLERELETWLDLVEERVEGYRASYMEMTGIDLGAPELKITEAGHPKIRQQA